MIIFDSVLNELGVVVLTRTADQSFIMLSHQCEWFEAMSASLLPSLNVNNQTISESDLCDAFPFIENFLIDASKVWQAPEQPSLSSGIWTETNASGVDFQLQARACYIQGQSILLIENHTDAFSQRHSVYQKARNIALLNEKLVSELNQRQRQLQNEIERHILQNTSIKEVEKSVRGHASAVMICQPDGKIEVMNKALIDIYQIENGEELTRISLLDQWVSEAENQYPELKRVLEKGSYWEGEFESKDTAGTSRWVRLTIGPIKERNGDITHFVCVANDISEFRNLENEPSGEGGYDYTTHLPNRRYFWQHINTLSEAEQSSEYGIGLLYLDLDYFKRINDDLGHQAGDFLLSAIASRISRSVKYNDFVAHLGGDEFAILVRFIENDDQLKLVAERLLLSIHEPLYVDGHTVAMSASIGIATSFETRLDPALLVRQADLAMYAAKELGKGQMRFYNSGMENSIPHRLQRERELLEAIENNEFVLHLQPQISITGSTQLRAEALVRWQHPRHNLLPPADFIPIAEDSGLIIPIGQWVLREACKMGVQLNRDGREVCIAVNISAKQLKHPDFYTLLTNTLKETFFPAELLELEITESSFLEDMGTVVSLIKKIRLLGVSISLDDFGTGFSSLNYLRQLPVDYLKIDRSFVQELQYDRESQAITASVINLARELKIKVVAEGVETQQQFSFLQQRQVNFVQGFLFYEPLPLDAFIGYFSQMTNLNSQNKTSP
jgi:diguanylate cyclase (GGDEF)-like protein/PAS domain S-box-containing protein